MSERSPLVSIIMAAYNADAFIAGAISSALDQSHERIELLVVDDGSDDQTSFIVNGFHDSRIRYFYQPNLGVSAARNRGLQKMRGDFFCFLDADDQLTPESIARRLRVFEEESSVSFVDGHVELCSPDMKQVTGLRKLNYKGNPFRALLEIDNSCFFGPTWMIRVVRGQSYAFNEKLTHSEDLLFYLSISVKGGEYRAVDEAIYRYRKGHTSAMSNLDKLWEGYKEVFREIRSWPEVSPKEALLFGRIIRMIMFKSFLRKFRILGAVKALKDAI